MAKKFDLTPPGKVATTEVSSVVPEKPPVTKKPSIQIVSVDTLQPVDGIEYKTRQSAGFDIPVSVSRTINPGDSFLFSTGLRLLVTDWEDPEGTVTYGDMRIRSSIRKLGMSGLGEAVIDLDYEGEIKVLVHNHSKKAQHVQANTRVAQIIFTRVLRPDGIPVADTVRGEGGLGSTGTN